MEKHRVLREVLRHYLTFESLCAQSGQYVIEYNGMMISFVDLQNALRSLSPRKKEAVTYNVILDYKQKDVAEIMGITTVSVGQYVEQAMLQIAKKYFAEMEDGDVSGLHVRDDGPDLGSPCPDPRPPDPPQFPEAVDPASEESEQVCA